MGNRDRGFLLFAWMTAARGDGLAGRIMVQRTLDFEVEKLIKRSGGRLKRGSQVRRRGQLPPTDPHVTEIGDVVRFTSQNDVILDRLERGPAENYELAALAINYRARISDLRKYGYRIEVERCGGGKNRYVLSSRPEKAANVRATA